MLCTYGGDVCVVVLHTKGCDATTSGHLLRQPRAEEIRMEVMCNDNRLDMMARAHPFNLLFQGLTGCTFVQIAYGL